MLTKYSLSVMFDISGCYAAVIQKIRIITVYYFTDHIFVCYTIIIIAVERFHIKYT